MHAALQVKAKAEFILLNFLVGVLRPKEIINWKVPQ